MGNQGSSRERRGGPAVRLRREPVAESLWLGVDLGHLRMQMAVWYGADAPAHVLDGWQRESGREATDMPYWDAVAALHTPTDLQDWGLPVFDEEGNQLGPGARTERRDVFLRTALEQLGSGRPTYEWLG